MLGGNAGKKNFQACEVCDTPMIGIARATSDLPARYQCKKCDPDNRTTIGNMDIDDEDRA